MASSYEYEGLSDAFREAFPDFGPQVCPRCHQEIQLGDNVHEYGGRTWHTIPCPN